MQIALCHENVLPARGGAEMYVADLARQLVAAGHDVHLYACAWDESALPPELHCHGLPKPRGPRSLRPWQFSAAVQAAIQRNRPQVSLGFDKVLGTDVYYPLGGLHVASAAHNLLKHKSGPSRVIAGWIQHCDTAQRSYARIERRLLLGPQRPLLVTNSALVRDHARQYYGINPAEVPVIHNAIDPDRFSEVDRPQIRAAMRHEWGLQPLDVVGAVVAMNYRLKGLEALLRALRHVPMQFKLVVAGSSKTPPWRRLAEKLGIAERVRFLGPCTDVRRVFFAADLLVHPTFYDPCSGVVLEALACGVPIITTKNNGAGELMHPPAEGYVIDDPHHEKQLATCIAQMLDRDRRTMSALAARQTAGQWTFDHHVRKFELVLSGVAEQKLRAAG